MTITRHEKDAEARTRALTQFADEARRAMALAHEAVDRLDPGGIIAHARTLKSTVWRAERAGVTLLDLKPAVGPDRPHLDTEPHEGSEYRASVGTRRSA